jgi:hypothetical protein
MVFAVYMPPQAPTDGQAFFDEVFVAHLAGAVGADRFEHADHGQILALPFAGLDGAGVDVNAGHVDARHCDHAARHVLVAAAAHQHAVHRLAVDRGFNRIGDDFARHQRVFHRFGAHADAVGDRRHAKDLRHRAGCAQRRHRTIDQRLDAGIARVHVRVAVGDADDRFFEIAVAETDCAQHGAIGRACDARGDEMTAFVQCHDRLFL